MSNKYHIPRKKTWLGTLCGGRGLLQSVALCVEHTVSLGMDPVVSTPLAANPIPFKLDFTLHTKPRINPKLGVKHEYQI